MKYYIKILKNNVHDISDELQRFKEYFDSVSPFEVEYDIEEVEWDTPIQSTGSRYTAQGVKEMYRLQGVYEKASVLDLRKYHMCVFLHPKGSRKEYIANFTHRVALNNECYFVELITKESWVDDVFRVLSHEVYHVEHNRARANRFATIDTMDRYDDEFKPYSKVGNRARNNKELQPFWAYMTGQLDIMLAILGLAKKVVGLLTRRPSIETMAEAIKEFEGWFPTSRSWRQKNPGNLRFSPFETDNVDNFSVFPDYETGWKALLHQLEIAVDGRSSVYDPDDTLLEFFHKYAPSEDNNYPEVYAKYVAKFMGVDVDYQIGNLRT